MEQKYKDLIKQAIETEAEQRYTSDQFKERIAFAKGAQYAFNEVVNWLQQTITEHEEKGE